jgi:PAS domain S-box-containing protein
VTAAPSTPRTLRFHLTSLVFVSVVPLLIFAVIIAAILEKQQRTSLEHSFRDTVRALTVALDHELTSSILTLQALATSEHLDTGDLKLFYREAQRVVATRPGWITINLTDPSGQQLINVYRPFGAQLPSIGHLEDVRHTLDTGEPAISNLFTGLVLNVPTVGFTVPVRRRGTLKYVLGARLDVGNLSLLLSEGKLPPDWVAMIFDRQGTILARTRGIEQWLGKPAPAAFVTHSRQSEEGATRAVTNDGVAVYGAYRRSRLSGWTVGLGVPGAVVEAPGRTSRWAIIGGGSLFLLLGGVFATLFGRRIAGGIESLSISARALEQGQVPSLTRRSTIAEIAAVEREMVETARQRADAVAARLMSEEALRESEERTRLIVSRALDAVITIDADGRITSWNPQAARLFGWSEEEIRGRFLSETIIPPAYREGHERGLSHFLATGEGPVLNRRIELSALHRNGTEFSVELAITPLRAGGAVTFSAFLRDITEQKRTERALRDSEASFRLLFADNPLPMWVYDLATLAFLEVNDAAVAHYGYSREEFLRMRLSDIRPPEDVPRLEEVVKSLAEAAVQGVRHEGRWRHRLKDGRVIDVDILSHTLDFAGRRASLVVAIDVTEAKQTQDALAKYSERLSILHEIDRLIIAGEAPVTIAEAVLRRLRDLLNVPRAMVILFDLEAGQAVWLAAVGRRRFYRGPVVRYPLVLAGDLEALRRGQPQLIDVPALPSSPETLALLASDVQKYMVVPMIAGGELIGAVSFGGPTGQFPAEQVSIAQEAATQLAIAIAQARLYERVKHHAEELEQRVEERTLALRDANEELQQQIEERRRAEEEADRANRAKSDFLSRMSHELRTPLNGILGFAQLLQMESLPADQQESIAHILKAGRHLLGLINEVLDISRIEAGRLQLSLEPVPVSETLRGAVDLVRPLAAQRDIELAAEVADDHRHVLADRQRLQQVLLNLLSNAVKYNRTQGAVAVSCEERSGGRLRILVTDTGHGISPDKLERLFTPFDRLGAEGTGIEGTGLGLALSKHLIEVMGGTLDVTSQVGVGSTFAVELPLTADPADVLKVPGTLPTVQAERREGRIVVLYIEDNLSNLRLVERVLGRRPQTTLLSAMQGQLGLDLAREHRPDLILLDLHLPDIPGDEVLRRLLEEPRTRQIPVVILSADATPGQMERLLAAGVQAYLTKPLDVRQLLTLVDQAAVGKGA